MTSAPLVLASAQPLLHRPIFIHDAHEAPFDEQGRPIAPEPVMETTVIAWCYALAPAPDVIPHLQEIAAAIAQASTKDPLFAGGKGALATAALLVALGWSQSELHPTLVRCSEGRTGFGLFQIELDSPKLSADPFLLPRHAAHVAIEMLRQGFEVQQPTLSGHLPEPAFERALTWYNEPRPFLRARLALARSLLLVA